MIIRLSIVITLSFIIFGQFPEVDLGVSGFIFNATGFWDSPILVFIRNFYFRGSFYLLWLFLFLFIVSLIKNGEVAPRIYGFVVTFFLLGPVLFIHNVLKANWGRARPIHIEEFGGDKLFTPAQIFPVDQCGTNCSFASGEAGIAAALIFSLLLLFGRKRSSRVLIWIAFLPMAILRVFFGMHFLSDIFFAFLFIWFIGYILLEFFRMKPADFLLEKGAFWRDIKTSLTRLVSPLRK